MKLRMVFIFAMFALNTFAISKSAKNQIQKSISSINNVLAYFNCSNSDRVECKMIKRHLKRDTKRCYIHPEKINNLLNIFKEENLTRNNPLTVKGRNRYLGFVPGKYSYDMFFENDQLHLETSIYFFNWKKFSSTELNDYQAKMVNAGQRWWFHNPYKLHVHFNLKRSKTMKDSHIKFVRLKRGDTRGPYFLTWSTSWSYKTVSHEMGHMMGLDDEYRNDPFGGSQASCDSSSIMCSSYRGWPQEYQYYMILRRAICQM